jgi:hypothetical protein
MKKLLLSITVLAFIGGSVGCAMMEKMGMGEDKVAAACKGKKTGTMVKVDGKSVKCPAPK